MTTNVQAYAVLNTELNEAIAIFRTRHAAEAYAQVFPQCEVVGWRLPKDWFDPEADI